MRLWIRWTGSSDKDVGSFLVWILWVFPIGIEGFFPFFLSLCDCYVCSCHEESGQQDSGKRDGPRRRAGGPHGDSPNIWTHCHGRAGIGYGRSGHVPGFTGGSLLYSGPVFVENAMATSDTLDVGDPLPPVPCPLDPVVLKPIGLGVVELVSVVILRYCGDNAVFDVGGGVIPNTENRHLAALRVHFDAVQREGPRPPVDQRGHKAYGTLTRSTHRRASPRGGIRTRVRTRSAVGGKLNENERKVLALTMPGASRQPGEIGDARRPRSIALRSRTPRGNTAITGATHNSPGRRPSAASAARSWRSPASARGLATRAPMV